MDFNEQQQKIVNHINGPLLCIAGPGSGKTTCVVGRILNMIKNGVKPKEIMVVTFTKAAADDMKAKYTGTAKTEDTPTFGTIHSICFRILRNYDQERFARDSVLSEIDQKNFIRNEIKFMRIEKADQDAIINSIMAGISNVKNNQLDPAKIRIEGLRDNQFLELFYKYEDFKKEYNKIDYDDMVCLTYKWLKEDKKTLDLWQRIYKYFIVDEFQDTNLLQSRIFYLLSSHTKNICVVGDDDQCQPAGTKVLLSNGDTKNIEDVRAGDVLANMAMPNDETNTTNIVEDVATRKYTGDIVIVNSFLDLMSVYTPNHRTLVSLEFDENKTAVFFAQNKEGRFEAQRYPYTPNGLTAMQENCKKSWLISVTDGMNSLRFVTKQFVLDTLYFNGNYDKMLEKYNRKFSLPFYDSDIEWMNARVYKEEAPIQIFAQNLMEREMACVATLMDENQHTRSYCETIKKVTIVETTIPIDVYSLKTSTETYVADGIMTHNCIYRFRGAVPQIMLDFEKDFPGCQKVILNTNYRSEPQIVETSKRLIENNKARFEKPLAASKVGAADIEYVSYKNRDKEIAAVLRTIKMRQKKGFPLDEIAVLYRTNSQAAQITQAFIKADIPFYTNELITNIYDHWIFNDFKNFKKAADGTCTINEFLSIINRPNKYISRKILPNVYNEEEIMNSVFHIEEGWKRDKMRQTLDDWFYWIDKMSEMKPYDFIETLRKKLDYEKYVKTYATNNDFDVSQFIDIMNEIQDSAENFETFEEWYEYIDEELKNFKEMMKKKHREGSVALSTMHKAKGLEWEEVFVVDCNEDIIPYVKAEDPEDLEEERRMFYVAITRAKKTLHIYSIEKRNKAPMYLSRFVEEMKEPAPPVEEMVTQILNAPTQSTVFSQGTWVFHKTFGNGMVTRVEGKNVHIAFSAVGNKILDRQWCEENLQLF